MSACHAEGRGFEPRLPRHFTFFGSAFSLEPIFIKIRPPSSLNEEGGFWCLPTHLLNPEALLPVQRIYKRLRETEPFQALKARLPGPSEKLKLRGLPGSLGTFALGYLTELSGRPVLAIYSDTERADAARDDLERILPPETVGYFPDWDMSPYEGRSPHLDVVALRVEALDLLQRGACVVVTTASALLSHTLSLDLYDLAVRDLSVSQEADLQELATHLVETGYERVKRVEGVGQFSVRGGIVDVCSFGNDHPVRLEFWGDEITSIRAFDLMTQRSVETLETVRFLPAREVVFVETMQDAYQENLIELEKRLDIDLTVMRESLATEGAFDGAEQYLGALYEGMCTFFDHLPPDGLIYVDDPPAVDTALEAASDRIQKAAGRGKPRREQPEPLPASEVAVTVDSVQTHLASRPRVHNEILGKSDDSLDFGGVTARRYEGHLPVLEEDLTRLWRDGYDLVLLCESQGQKARMEELLAESRAPLAIDIGTLQTGFIYPAGRVAVTNDHEVYSRHRRQRRYRRFSEGAPIKSVTALQKGDFVVHVDHGIGRYAGLNRLSVDGISRDCLTLSYREGDRVFVPVDQMDRVQKYSSQEGAAPILSKLGSAAWERVKEKTKKEIFKMATEIVSLYAERKARPGTKFTEDGALHLELAASFPFQETRDQMRAIDEVREDMESSSAMDRLICGDVGYGKTEVAIRAAFKAINDGKQVAVLVPTTILAQQHGRTFEERMQELPVKVDVLSRFRTRAEQTQVITGVKSGQVDVLIGTHRLLSKDVEFKDLGLLVVDEEHRFGVRHKERLKQMRRLVDVLTLTATPIPRTLHMSLMGARDMSIIETAPKERLPIHTEIQAFSEEHIAEGILREIDRGGQVYFVHNRVQSINSMKEFLERLVPQVRFGVGHGQMAERELEKVMIDFMDRKYDCLISTMIIESGLDIPSVNTLIVNRADRLGLAQLYQLRGRVGRSNQRAYAFLLIPSWKSLRKPAVRRLRAIEEFSDLGSGFHISMRDMEIRGAGNLLGAQQHGHISAIGFDMYCRLLDEAVNEIKGEDVEPAVDPDIQVSVSAYIPDDYVADADEKMSFYQRLGEARRTVEVLTLEEELQDRFGKLPEPTASLLDTLHLRLLGRQLKIETVNVGPLMTLTFLPDKVLSREEVERMVKQSPQPLQFLLGETAKIEIELEGNNAASRVSSAKKVLMSLI